MSDNDRDRIRKSLQMLFDVHNHKHTPAGLDHWVTKLEPLASANLWRALTGALDADKMPSLNSVLAEVSYRNRVGDDMASLSGKLTLTPAERERANKAAVMSLMWLRYFHPGAVSMIGPFIAKLMDIPSETALEKAEERYPKWLVEKWMDDQRAAGN